VEGNAKANLRYDALYLFTHHIGLYEKYDWAFVSEIDTVLGKPVLQRLYRMELRR